MKKERTNEPIINTAQLKEGERAVNRIVKMRELEIRAKFRAERRTLEEATRKKYGLDELEAENDRLYDMWTAAKDAQEKAERKVHNAIQTRLARIDQEEASELTEANADGVERSLRLIAASLPASAVSLIGLDDIKVPRLLGVSSDE